jgi:hypothetical protein
VADPVVQPTPDGGITPRRPVARMAGHRGGRPAPSRRPSFYALTPGGWRDYVTLLHPPYTVWHLSYVAMGAAVAPRFDTGRLGATLVAFFLGVGVTAHSFDELAGRPLSTGIPDAVLKALGYGALAGAVGLGVLGAAVVSWWLLVFVAFGAFVVVAYNLELFDGRFHSDLWFAVSWGAFPALTGAFAQTGTVTVAACLVAAACLFLSVAQRRLSTPVRRFRRRVVAVEGRILMSDGTESPIDERTLRAAPEAGLRSMWLGMALLGAGMVAARLAGVL